MTSTTVTRDVLIAAIGIAALFALTQTASRLDHVGTWRSGAAAPVDAAAVSTARGLRGDTAAPILPEAVVQPRVRN
jgi:hypothetical protein